MSKPLMPNVNDKFDSLEAFEDAARLAAKYEGFAFSRKDSNLTGCKGKSLFVVLQCTKEETSKRKKTTKREGCPVYIRATATKCHSTTSVLNTEVRWIVTKAVLEHKHTMLELDEVATFLQYRAMSLNQKNLVQQLHDNNAPTRVITAAVNKVINGGIILSKDIVNERARIRLALNEGYNNDSTQILLRLLEERDYMVVAHKTTKGYLTHLFFSHVEAAKCVAKCPEVLIVDATYRTNIYKYLLVSAVGINNISNEKGVLAFYQIAMAWIDNESEASYTWFLQTLRTKIYNAYGCLPDVFMSDRDQALRNASSKVFPESNKMLCVWHLLEQNLKVNCRKLFKNDEDYEMFKKEVEALRFSECEEEIPQSLNAIKKAAEKSHSPEKVESYIQTWMKDSKLWILAYTKQFCHIGISTTGRSESSHSTFKRAIETASDLESVFRQIDQVMRLQHLKSAIRMGSNKVAIDPFTLHNPIFSELIGK
ncbi:13689_t:CDS:2, partial [Dentiscutata heterogama]